MVFDLGIRRQLEMYLTKMSNTAMTQQPVSGNPDTVASLVRGGLVPEDVDHVHMGTPFDSPTSLYVVRPGAMSLIDGITSGIPS